MQTLRGPVYLTGREYYEVMEPWFELIGAISNHLAEVTDEVKLGEQLLLPPFEQWEVPENDLMDEEVEAIAGEAGFNIEACDDGSFIYYNN